MGTKNEPGAYDCYEKADPDEPMFILLARDASAPALIEMWADMRERHGEEAGVVAEARECAEKMRAWRDHNRSPVNRHAALIHELRKNGGPEALALATRLENEPPGVECPGCGSRGELHRTWCTA